MNCRTNDVKYPVNRVAVDDGPMGPCPVMGTSFKITLLIC